MIASREWNADWRCSIRSWTHLTGRPRRTARAAAATSSGRSCIFGPKPPPTSGATTRIRPAAIRKLRARPSRRMWGTWVEEWNSRVPFAPVVRGHHPAPLHGHSRDAGVAAGETDPDRGPLEALPLPFPGCPLGAEEHVVRRVLVQAGRVPAGRRARVRDHRERLVVDLDEGGRVLGEVPASRGDHGHDLPRVADRLRGHRVPVGRPEERGAAGCHLRPDGGDRAREVRSGDHRLHAGRAARPARVDGPDAGVRPRAPHERELERAGRRPEVVEKASLAAEERPVLGSAGVGHAGNVLRRPGAAGHRPRWYPVGRVRGASDPNRPPLLGSKPPRETGHSEPALRARLGRVRANEPIDAPDSNDARQSRQVGLAKRNPFIPCKGWPLAHKCRITLR